MNALLDEHMLDCLLLLYCLTWHVMCSYLQSADEVVVNRRRPECLLDPKKLTHSQA